MKYANLNRIKPHSRGKFLDSRGQFLDTLGLFLDVIVNTRLLNNSIYDIADEIDYPSLLKKNPLSRIPNRFRKYSIFCTWVVETTNLSNGKVDLTQLLLDYIYQSEQYCPKNNKDRKNALCSSNIINEHIGCGPANLENFCSDHESVLNLKSKIRDYQSHLENLCNLMDAILFGKHTYSELYKNTAIWSKDPTITLLLILKVIVPVNAVHKDVDDEVLYDSYERLYYFLSYYTSRDNEYDNSRLIEDFKINLLDIRQNPGHRSPYPRIYSIYYTKKILEDYIRYKQSFVVRGIEIQKTFPQKLKGVFESFLCEGYPSHLRFNPTINKYYCGHIIHFEKIDGFVLMHEDHIDKSSTTIFRETYICEFDETISTFKIRPLSSFNRRDVKGAVFEFIHLDNRQPEIAATIYDGGLLEGRFNGFERIKNENNQTKIRRYQESFKVRCQHFSSLSAKLRINTEVDEIIFRVENANIILKSRVSELPFLRNLNYDDECYYVQFGSKDDKRQKHYLYFPRLGITLDDGKFVEA